MNKPKSDYAYSVGCLLFLVTLLVGFSLVVIWNALLLAQGLPSVAKDFADLACEWSACVSDRNE